MEAEPKPILTAQEVAKLVSTHPRTLRRWAHEGLFPRPLRVGRSIRWRREDIDRWIEEQAS